MTHPLRIVPLLRPSSITIKYHTYMLGHVTFFYLAFKQPRVYPVYPQVMKGCTKYSIIPFHEPTPVGFAIPGKRGKPILALQQAQLARAKLWALLNPLDFRKELQEPEQGYT